MSGRLHEIPIELTVIGESVTWAQKLMSIPDH